MQGKCRESNENTIKPINLRHPNQIGVNKQITSLYETHVNRQTKVTLKVKEQNSVKNK